MAVADPEVAYRIARRVASVYEAAELDLQSQVAKRLARGVDTPGWAEGKLAEIGEVRRQAQARIGRLDATAAKVTKDSLQAVAPSVTGTLGSKTNQRAVEVLVEQTITKLRSTHFQLLRATDDQYRRVVASTVSQVAAGSTTTRVAAQRTVFKLARQGLGAFIDSKGRVWKASTYAQMAVRTATAQAMVGGRLNQYLDDGRHLVIVSDSPDECKKCRPWEGEILFIDGAQLTPEERKLAKASVKEATREGLFHPNCTHDLRPFIPGLSKRFKSESGLEGEQQRAAETKAQRKVQEAKRQDVATEPFGDSPVRQHVQAKVRAANDDAVQTMVDRYRTMHGKNPSANELAKLRKRAERGDLSIPPQAISPSDAVTQYTSESGYEAINTLLRGQESKLVPHVKDYYADRLDSLVAGVDQAIADADLVTDTLYRGLGGTEGERLFDLGKDAVGQVLTDDAFVSTSTSKAAANQFSNLVTLQIDTGPGVRGLSIPGKEAEVLLARGTRMEVTAVKELTSRTIVHVRVLPELS